MTGPGLSTRAVGFSTMVVWHALEWVCLQSDLLRNDHGKDPQTSWAPTHPGTGHMTFGRAVIGECYR